MVLRRARFEKASQRPVDGSKGHMKGGHRFLYRDYAMVPTKVVTSEPTWYYMWHYSCVRNLGFEGGCREDGLQTL